MRVQILKRVTIPVLSQVEDFIQIKIAVMRTREDGARVIDPRNGGGEHIERVAGEVDDAHVWEEFSEGLNLGAERGRFCHVIFFARCIQMAL